MSLPTRGRAGIAALAFVVAASACGGSDEPSDTAATTAGGSSTDAATTSGVEGPSGALNDVFASAGIEVIDDPGDGSGVGLELWSFQVENLQRELDAGGGYLGAELDELAGSPGGLPFSYLVAGWLDSAPTPIAESALGLMGDQKWEQAPSLLFPTAVLVLFVADAVQAAGGSQPQAMASARLVSLAQGGICSTLSSWVNSALDFIFDSLKVNTDDDGFLGWLGGIWNAAVDLAKAAVGGLIELLTAPVIALVTDALVVVGTLNMITGLLKPWDLKITPSSTDTRFAVGAEPDIEEAFVARVDTGIDFTWPADLVDCANLAGLELPDPKSAQGSTVAWTVIGLPEFGSLINNQNVIDEENTATLNWVTGREDSDRGEAENATVVVRAKVVSKQIEELKAMLEALISGQVPVSPFGDIVGALFSSITGPIFEALAELIAVSGTARTGVLYHEPEDAPIMGFAWELRATKTITRPEREQKRTVSAVLVLEFAEGQEFDEPHPRYVITGGTVTYHAVDYYDTSRNCAVSAPERSYDATSANFSVTEFRNFIEFDTTVTPVRYRSQITTENGLAQTVTQNCEFSGVNEVDYGGNIGWFSVWPDSEPVTDPELITGSEFEEYVQGLVTTQILQEWTITRIE